MDESRQKAGSFVVFAVADARRDDFAALVSQFAPSGVHWQFVATAGEALRLARTQPVDLWLINTKLADMPGSQLCAMIREMHCRQAIGMMADAYDADEERQARTHGASFFVCKPPGSVWCEFLTLSLQRILQGLQLARAPVLPHPIDMESFPVQNH